VYITEGVALLFGAAYPVLLLVTMMLPSVRASFRRPATAPADDPDRLPAPAETSVAGPTVDVPPATPSV
jgi:hypothetical protein